MSHFITKLPQPTLILISICTQLYFCDVFVYGNMFSGWKSMQMILQLNLSILNHENRKKNVKKRFWDTKVLNQRFKKLYRTIVKVLRRNRNFKILLHICMITNFTTIESILYSLEIRLLHSAITSVILLAVKLIIE